MSDNTPKIVVSFGADTVADTIAIAKQGGMDIAEIRADLLDNTLEIIELLAGVEILLTIRTTSQGGQWQKSDTERVALFVQLIPKVTMVDIELNDARRDEIYQIAQKHGKLVIFSQHDFTCTPELSALKSLLNQTPESAIFKIATMVNNQSDLHTLVQLLQDSTARKITVIGMGELGKVSRVFFPSLGSMLAFTYVGTATAPGQLSLSDTKQLVDLFYR